MPLKDALKHIALYTSLAIGSGCTLYDEVRLDSQRVNYILNQQRELNSYGGNLVKRLGRDLENKGMDMYDDFFREGQHSFGSRTIIDERGLLYLIIYCDELKVADFGGNGVVDFLELHPKTAFGQPSHNAVKRVVCRYYDLAANELYDTVLDIMIEKGRTRVVSEESMRRFRRVKDAAIGQHFRKKTVKLY